MAAAVASSSVASAEGRWSSQKTTAAPPPPVTILQQEGSSVIRLSPPSNSSVSSLHSSRNYPDVLDTQHREITQAEHAGSQAVSNEELSPGVESVVPDYPMDTLPRSGHGGSDQGNASGNGQQTVSSNSSVRPVENTQTNIVVNVVHPVEASMSSQAVVVSSSQPVRPLPGSSLPAVTDANAPRSSPPHLESVSHQIRTQDLNVGVVAARVEHQRLNDLPDLLAHSQSATALPTAGLPAPQHPVPAEHHRPSESHGHSRHRTHRDPRTHRSGHHGRSRRHSHRHSRSVPESQCEETCMKCVAVTTSFRWILVILSLLGVCCVVTGIVLAALHAAGNSFLFLAIMFIGLGVLLVVVVGVGWKCTPRGHEPLHALFGLGNFRRPRSSRRHRSRQRRDGRWYGGMMYPEFQYRRPPPSYNASMQEYQQQLAIAQQQQQERDHEYDPDNLPDEDYSLPSSPPPSYRSRASTVRTGIQITFPPNQGGDYPESRPPTYRSHSSTLPGSRHPRPSLPRDEDLGDDNPAPSDVAFTDSVFVDVNGSQTNASLVTTNQNVTVSVPPVTVTVNVMSQSDVAAVPGPSRLVELPPSSSQAQQVEAPVKTSDVAVETDRLPADQQVAEEPERFDTAL